MKWNRQEDISLPPPLTKYKIQHDMSLVGVNVVEDGRQNRQDVFFQSLFGIDSILVVVDFAFPCDKNFLLPPLRSLVSCNKRFILYFFFSSLGFFFGLIVFNLIN